MTDLRCIEPGCEKPSRNKGTAALCAMHYHRQYRHGSTSIVSTESDLSVSTGRRYKVKYKPDHPLAMKDGRVYEHRMVLFDTIGPGPHACHWCETEVDWLPKCDPRELQPDHLNNDGADNQPSNLVASCRRCNTARGSQRRAAALRAAGWWTAHDTVAHLKSGGRVAPIDSAA